MREAHNEPGAKRHRVKFLQIDPHKGSATGYVAKYVAKNIDGHAVGPDFEDTEKQADASDTVQRVDTWASVWCVRQFQQIGGPPVGVWRELRRISSAPAGRLERARQAADDGDWCAYYEALGGHQTPFRNRPIRILRLWIDKPGSYDEPIGYVTKVVIHVNEHVWTRPHEWKIQWIPSDGARWTRVNNCTLKTPVSGHDESLCSSRAPPTLKVSQASSDVEATL